GHALHGEVVVSGAKNAVLPALAATLLTGKPCTIDNVPDIDDVDFMVAILESIGAQVERNDPGTITVTAADVTAAGPPSDLVVHIRASFLTMGALLGRQRQ